MEEIPNYEGYFRSKDRIIKYKQSGTRNYPGKSLKVEVMQDGYSRIVLMKEGVKKRYMCHRLVAETYIPNPDNKPYVNHIDGNRSNNCVEWCTQSENERHSVDVLGKSMKGKTAPKAVRCIENDTIYKSMSEAVRLIGKPSCGYIKLSMLIGCIMDIHLSSVMKVQRLSRKRVHCKLLTVEMGRILIGL